MLEQILNLITRAWDDIRCFTFMNDYEVGIIYRVGSYHREMKVGWNWKYPFLEEYKVVSCQDDTKQLKTQTVESVTGDCYTVTPVVCFYVKNARQYYRRVLSSADSIVDDKVAGVIADHFSRGCYDKNEILKEIREECQIYGYKVRDLSFATFAKIQTIRLIHNQDSGVING